MRGNATGMLIGAAVAAVIVALIMFLAGGVFADIGDDLGPLVLAPFVSIACTIPYAALFVHRGQRALEADLTDDDAFRAQVGRVRRTRWIGLGLCVIIALSFAVPTALGHMDGYGQSAIEAFQHLDENRRDYDERYGAGAYERDLKASGLSQGDFDDITFGTNLHEVIRMVVNPLALGNEVFWGALFCCVIAVGGIEVAVAKLAFDPQIKALQSAHKEEGASAGGPDLPEDVAALLTRVGNAPGVHAWPLWEPGSVGSPRADAVSSLIQSVGLSHVHQGLFCGLAFFISVVLSLIGVFLGLVD